MELRCFRLAGWTLGRLAVGKSWMSGRLCRCVRSLPASGESVKPVNHAFAFESSLRASLRVGLVLLPLLTPVLAGCEALRFPGMTPQPTSPSVAPIYTPTIAPMLLTPLPAATSSPISVASSASPTPTFGLPLPQPTCLATPMWGLGDVWKNEGVRTRLGCPVGEQIGVPGEEVYFQNGHMLWRPDAGLIYVLFDIERPGGWGAFVDTFQPTDLESDPTIVVPTSAAAGQVYSQPTGRFGKLWRENPWLREKLGWALKESAKRDAPSTIRFKGAAQDFEHGTLLWNGKVCFVLRTDDMSWTMY